MRLWILAIPFLALGGCMPRVANDGGMTGQNAPDVTVKKLGSSENVKLSDLKGKVVLLDFWATWCGPCRESSPEVDAAYRKYRDQGFDVMSITGEEEGEVERFMAKSNKSYPVYLEKFNEASAKYQVTGIPTFLVVGRDGKIVGDMRGYGPGAVTELVEAAMR